MSIYPARREGGDGEVLIARAIVPLPRAVSVCVPARHVFSPLNGVWHLNRVCARVGGPPRVRLGLLSATPDVRKRAANVCR